MKANAVFSGGGMKGIAFVGALAVADQRGYEWERVAGTSVGALLAALVASGFRPREIYELMGKFNFEEILDGDFQKLMPQVGMLASIFLEKGIYRGRALENWVRSLLGAKGVSTFGDLEPGKLTMIAADLTQNKMLVLPEDLVHYGIAPEDFSVAKAVRMSASLPFFFEPVLFKYGKTASYIVDGALVSNFPLWVFSADPWPTIGFRFQGETDSTKIRNMWDYLQALLSTAMGGHDKRTLSKLEAQTIAVPTPGVGLTDFQLTPGQKERLYRAGEKAAADFFAAFPDNH